MTKEFAVTATGLTTTIEVACPHCATPWALPRARIGPGGALVHCARCEGSFEWRLARGPAGSRRSPAGEDLLPSRDARTPTGEAPDFARAAHGATGTAGPPRERHAHFHVPPDDETVATVNAWSTSDLDTWLEDAVSAPPPANAVAELDPSDVTPDLVARLAVEELVSARAEELLGAYDRGTLFAEFGSALTEAWSQCRARLGSESDPSVFRAALNARLGIDLPAWENRG